MAEHWVTYPIAANSENSRESDKLLVNERDSECHKAVVSNSEVVAGQGATKCVLVSPSTRLTQL